MSDYVFGTGQKEVLTLVRKLRKAFPLKKNKHPGVAPIDAKKNDEAEEKTDEEHSEKNDSDEDFDAEKALRRNKQRHKKQIVLPTINLDEYVHLCVCYCSYSNFVDSVTETFVCSYSVNFTDDTHEDLFDAQDEEGNLDEDEDEDEDVIDFKGLSSAQPLWVLPLYSLLPSNKQAKVERYARSVCVVHTLAIF